MIVADLSPVLRAHVGVAVADHVRRLRRDGRAVPDGLAELSRWLLRPPADSGGQALAAATAAGQAGSDGGRAGPVVVPALLAGDAAAMVLGCSSRSLRRMAAAGQVPSVWAGRYRRYRPADLESYIRSLPAGEKRS